MACRKEHDDHHGHDDHDHDHDHELEQERGIQYSLWQHINMEHVFCLNEEKKGMGRAPFKPYESRQDTTRTLRSDVDEELILHVPFHGNVKLKSLIVVGCGENAPDKLKIFINREDIDFGNANDMQPTQEWELAEDSKGEIEYPTKISKFNNVSSLTFYFPSNHGGEDFTEISYIGLKGDFTQQQRKAVQTTYESKPQAKDHKTKDEYAPNMGL